MGKLARKKIVTKEVEGCTTGEETRRISYWSRSRLIYPVLLRKLE